MSICFFLYVVVFLGRLCFLRRTIFFGLKLWEDGASARELTKGEGVKVDIVNTIIYCKNWLASVAFYRDELKFEVAFANDWFVEFKLNEAACLSVVDETRAAIGHSNGEGMMISFKVGEIESVYLEMESLKLNPTPIKMVWGADVFSVFDPEGTQIEFWSKD